MRPESGTNEEVPAQSGPEMLADGQDWSRRVQAGHAAGDVTKRVRAARWAEGNEGPGDEAATAATLGPAFTSRIASSLNSSV